MANDMKVGARDFDREIVILTDYRGSLYHIHNSDLSLNLSLLRKFFQDRGYLVTEKQFSEINFLTENYSGKYIFYQSSEDRHLYYKSYIEDILLGLKSQGAVLIPDFNMFRSHHNKVFMQILLDLNANPEVKYVPAKGYGTFEEFKRESNSYNTDVVLKPAEGCCSMGVFLLKSDKDKRKYVKRVSQSFHFMDALKNIVKQYVRKNYSKKSNHRKKFIIQNYLPNLDNDYKVLVFGDKYYLLLRRNRKNDFRASGSGLFELVTEPHCELLDFSKKVFEHFDVPYVSLDVGHDGKSFYIFEIQFLHFGTKTMELSDQYFTKKGNDWISVSEKPVPEREFAYSIANYIENK